MRFVRYSGVAVKLARWFETLRGGKAHALHTKIAANNND